MAIVTRDSLKCEARNLELGEVEGNGKSDRFGATVYVSSVGASLLI